VKFLALLVGAAAGVIFRHRYGTDTLGRGQFECDWCHDQGYYLWSAEGAQTMIVKRCGCRVGQTPGVDDATLGQTTIPVRWENRSASRLRAVG
jgi:hypothetical protein